MTSKFSSEPNIFAITLLKLSSSTLTRVARSIFLVSLNSLKVSIMFGMSSFFLAAIAYLKLIMYFVYFTSFMS